MEKSMMGNLTYEPSVVLIFDISMDVNSLRHGH